VKIRFKFLIAGILTAGLVAVPIAANASQGSATVATPAVSTSVSPHGYIWACAVVQKSTGTAPFLDYHGPYVPTNKCGAGHQLVQLWAGALPVAPTPAYGYALVNVKRGAGAAATWATYSTTIGSPVGDTTGGTFRTTCSTANAPCVISVQAYTTVDGVKMYPRLDISKDDYNTGAAVGNCEYGDGVDNDSNLSAVLSTSAATPTDIPLGIGGTLDCGSAQVRPATGIVSSIEVPAGYYDVMSTFVFKK
jgi:hypothetical protein